MHLESLHRGHRLREKLLHGLIRLLGRTEVPDVVRVLTYRPELFGRSHSKLHQAIMRGPSDWTVAEREMMATFVSARNQCRHCVSIHRAVTAAATGSDEEVTAILEDLDSAPISESLRATLRFLEILTVAPERLTTDDAARVRAAGVSDSGLRDAIYICFMFCIMNRLMDGLGARNPTPKQLAVCNTYLLKIGYDKI